MTFTNIVFFPQAYSCGEVDFGEACLQVGDTPDADCTQGVFRCTSSRCQGSKDVTRDSFQRALTDASLSTPACMRFSVSPPLLKCSSFAAARVCRAPRLRSGQRCRSAFGAHTDS